MGIWGVSGANRALFTYCTRYIDGYGNLTLFELRSERSESIEIARAYRGQVVLGRVVGVASVF